MFPNLLTVSDPCQCVPANCSVVVPVVVDGRGDSKDGRGSGAGARWESLRRRRRSGNATAAARATRPTGLFDDYM
jgi:hypothetical protein